jgi:monothiol glutaredoxin
MTTTAPAGIRQLTVQELKALLDSKAPLQLLDVRSEAERRIAKIEGARNLDKKTVPEIDDLDPDTLLVFLCHHGMRSLAAAQHFQSKGFTNLGNVVGGIEAWSAEVDPSVPRY